MKLPNAENAVIPDEKLSQYCLSTNHHHGQHKAILFNKLLGITPESIGRLRSLLLSAIKECNVIRVQDHSHGVVYYVDSEVAHADRTFEWFITLTLKWHMPIGLSY
jgi:hypothetical protein